VIDTSPPLIRLVHPSALFIDPKYQRDLSDRSIRLIGKIVKAWDWKAFKPPICAEVDGQLHVLDGQHTAIAAVTHGGISELPVMIVEADEENARASAFVKHNRDRISVTATQLHAALVQAGDQDALTIAQACERAGVRVLKNPPPNARFKPGDTMAISTLQHVAGRRYAKGLREVPDVCVASGAAPIGAHLIRAVEALLFEQEYKGEIAADRIATVIQAKGGKLENEAKRFAAERRSPMWRAYASVIFMSRKRLSNG
jgi:hypothetical protein